MGVQNKETHNKSKLKEITGCQHVNYYCNTCGRYGHKAYDCDFMAKLLKMMDHLMKLEGNAKQALISKHLQEQKHHKKKCKTC